MVEKKTSVRSQDPGQRRVLDRAARQRRINRQLEALENDNFQDDPHAGLPQLGKRLPQFDDDADTGKKKKKTRGDHFKLRFRKNFQALLEEQVREELVGRNPQRHLSLAGVCYVGGLRSCGAFPLVSAEPECGRGPQLPDSLCGTPVPAPAPLLCCMWLPLPIHLHQLWRPVLHCALSGHPPGDQVPEVDCVSLGIPGEEGPPCITLALERTSTKRKGAPLDQERNRSLTQKTSSREDQSYSQGCGREVGQPPEYCRNKRSHVRKHVPFGHMVFWG